MAAERSVKEIKEQKALLRAEARRRLRATSDEYRSTASAAICELLTGLDEYASADTVFAYCSMGREVSTDALVERVLADGKRLCLPRCVDIDENGRKLPGVPEMEARLVSDTGLMSKGAYGIREPVVMKEDGRADEEETSRLFPPADPADIDLVVLPCVACDASCGRLGRGAGYYDKFLSELRQDCVTIAVCFDKLILDEIPMEEHDMPVKAVITEKAVYRWRPQDPEGL